MRERRKSVSENLLKVVESLVEAQKIGKDTLGQGGDGGAQLPPFNGALPRFSATQDPEEFVNVENFINMLEFAMPSAQWRDQQRVLGAMRALEGEVLHQVRCLPEAERDTWIKFKSVLREKFSVTDQTLALLKSRYKPRRKSGEDLLSFVFRVRGGLSNFDPKGVWTDERRVSELIDILEREAPEEVCPMLYLLEEDSNTKLRQLVDGWNRIVRKRAPREKKEPYVEGDVNAIGEYSRGGEEPSRSRGRGYPQRRGVGRGRGCGYPSGGRGYPGRGRGQHGGGSGRCFNCGGVGHIASDCTRPPKCYRCQGSGHISRDCRWQPGAVFSSKNG